MCRRRWECWRWEPPAHIEGRSGRSPDRFLPGRQQPPCAVLLGTRPSAAPEGYPGELPSPAATAGFTGTPKRGHVWFPIPGHSKSSFRERWWRGGGKKSVGSPGKTPCLLNETGDLTSLLSFLLASQAPFEGGYFLSKTDLNKYIMVFNPTAPLRILGMQCRPN
jgi:hypothetical protein